jgi:hypothetical protein
MHACTTFHSLAPFFLVEMRVRAVAHYHSTLRRSGARAWHRAAYTPGARLRALLWCILTSYGFEKILLRALLLFFARARAWHRAAYTPGARLRALMLGILTSYGFAKSGNTLLARPPVRSGA